MFCSIAAVHKVKDESSSKGVGSPNKETSKKCQALQNEVNDLKRTNEDLKKENEQLKTKLLRGDNYRKEILMQNEQMK